MYLLSDLSLLDILQQREHVQSIYQDSILQGNGVGIYDYRVSHLANTIPSYKPSFKEGKDGGILPLGSDPFGIRKFRFAARKVIVRRRMQRRIQLIKHFLNTSGMLIYPYMYNDMI